MQLSNLRSQRSALITVIDLNDSQLVSRIVTGLSVIVLHLCKEEPREPMSYTMGFLVKVSDQHESVAGADDGVRRLCNAFSIDKVMLQHFIFNIDNSLMVYQISTLTCHA